jgi:hypothetical protein
MLALSWVLGGLLAAAVGGSLVASGGAAARTLGLVCMAIGAVGIVGTLRVRVRVRVSDSRVDVRNHLRSYRLDPREVAAIESSTAATPLTWARGWPVLAFRLAGGQEVRLIATTGMDQAEALVLVQAIREANPAVAVEERLLQVF